jgi:lipopolysaccharide export system protein LptA
MENLKKNRPLLLLVLLAGFAANVGSQKDDSKDPTYIEADGATYDKNTGMVVYTGRVELTQGRMLLKSDKLVVYTTERKPNKYIATGDPVTFRQTSEPGEAEYYKKQDLLVMIKKAVIWQGEDTYASERIEWDRKAGIIRAGDLSSRGKRVHITLFPDEKTE